MNKTVEGYVVAVETLDGLRYIGEGMAIVRAKLDAEVFHDLGLANGKCNQLQNMFPDKSFGVELAYGAEQAFRKENGY